MQNYYPKKCQHICGDLSPGGPEPWGPQTDWVVGRQITPLGHSLPAVKWDDNLFENFCDDSITVIENLVNKRKPQLNINCGSVKYLEVGQNAKHVFPFGWESVVVLFF